jgi:hypothetical protein
MGKRSIKPDEVCDLHFHETLAKSMACVTLRAGNKAADIRSRLGISGTTVGLKR